MSEKLLVMHCSPTLAGIKTGSLFNCTYNTIPELRSSLRKYNKLLVKKGLRIILLRTKGDRALVYVYRPSMLSCDLKQDIACDLLQKCGYCMEKPERCLVHLIKRLSESDEFPHEIGLFLGYPPEDVYGFIENKAENCKCVGYWKVYGDEIKAQQLFAKYKKCTDVYCAQLAKGTSIERLTVAG